MTCTLVIETESTTLNPETQENNALQACNTPLQESDQMM